MEWKLQDAKNRFHEVVQQARTQGPQIVTVRDKRVVVVLSAQDYDSWRAGRPTLVEVLLDGPRWDDDFAKAVTARAKLPGRDHAF